WHQRGDTQPVEARIDPARTLAEGLLLTSEVATFARRPSGEGLEAYLELDRRARLARTWGDAYGYLMVATGRADLMIDPQMSLWDAAALQPIIEEAGGVFCDWEGNATVHSGEAMAGNRQVVDEALSITQRR